MRYLHDNRLVHGDLKPQNVMLQPSPDGGVPEACPPLTTPHLPSLISGRWVNAAYNEQTWNAVMQLQLHSHTPMTMYPPANKDWRVRYMDGGSWPNLWGWTFKGSIIDVRCYWQWIHTTNEDVHNTVKSATMDVCHVTLCTIRKGSSVCEVCTTHQGYRGARHLKHLQKTAAGSYHSARPMCPNGTTAFIATR
jgi:serine/threonine protein kinase